MIVISLFLILQRWLVLTSVYLKVLCIEKTIFSKGNLLWCQFCNVKVDHEVKSVVDKHLQTIKHENNKKNTNNSNQLIQRTITSLVGNTLNERELINIEIVEAFTFADIPLEKIEKLKPFLLKYCKNGM